jgi:hypothetical protein
LNDKFARDGIRGILADGCGKFISHQIRKDLANLAKADGAAAGADERPIEVYVVAALDVAGSGATERIDGAATLTMKSAGGRRLVLAPSGRPVRGSV